MLARCDTATPPASPLLARHARRPADVREAESLRVFHTPAHVCGYFPDRIARDLVLDPRDPQLAQRYAMALAWGFRRSGDILYRPHCHGCRACVAVRIPVAQFLPDRSQRRCLARNADLEVRVVPAEPDDERIALYTRYLRWRHPGGGMDGHGAAEFAQFLIGGWSEGRFLEFRERGAHGPGALLGLAVTDVLPDALSAVYTCYAPEAHVRGLGTFGLLQQVDWARRSGRAHLYLGYWIEGHDKMDYKRRFRPLEGYDGRHWRRLGTPR